MSKARWSLKFKAGLYVGFFTIFFIITLMAAVGFGFDRYYYFCLLYTSPSPRDS